MRLEISFQNGANKNNVVNPQSPAMDGSPVLHRPTPAFKIPVFSTVDPEGSPTGGLNSQPIAASQVQIAPRFGEPISPPGSIGFHRQTEGETSQQILAIQQGVSTRPVDKLSSPATGNSTGISTGNPVNTQLASPETTEETPDEHSIPKVVLTEQISGSREMPFQRPDHDHGLPDGPSVHFPIPTPNVVPIVTPLPNRPGQYSGVLRPDQKSNDTSGVPLAEAEHEIVSVEASLATGIESQPAVSPAHLPDAHRPIESVKTNQEKPAESLPKTDGGLHGTKTPSHGNENKFRMVAQIDAKPLDSAPALSTPASVHGPLQGLSGLNQRASQPASPADQLSQEPQDKISASAVNTVQTPEASTASVESSAIHAKMRLPGDPDMGYDRGSETNQTTNRLPNSTPRSFLTSHVRPGVSHEPPNRIPMFSNGLNTQPANAGLAKEMKPMSEELPDMGPAKTSENRYTSGQPIELGMARSETGSDHPYTAAQLNGSQTDIAAAMKIEIGVAPAIGLVDVDQLPRTVPAAIQALTASEISQPVLRQMVITTAAAPDQLLELTLAPEELGKVRLVLSATENGNVFSVQAERLETLELLRRNIDVLADELKEIGLDDVSFQFSTDHENTHQQATPADESESDSVALDPTERGPEKHHIVVASGRLDIRV